jgi:signal transduction histidine kinase
MRSVATVRVRITVAAVAVVALALAVGGVWVLGAQRTSLTKGIDATARVRASDVAAAVAQGDLMPTTAASPGDENLVQVVDGQGGVVSASTNIEGEGRISGLDPGRAGSVIRTVHNLPIGEAAFRVVARRVDTQRGPFIVYVAASLEPVSESTDSLGRLLAIGLPALLALLAATTWVVTGRALRPVEAIRREVEAIGARGLHRRVPEPKNDDEVGRLARTMNAMLSRLQSATDRQRRFVADASHELRSPLTGIRARLEVDLAHPDRADWEATHREVLDDTLRLQRLVEDLLVLARSDAGASGVGAGPTGPVDLDEIVLREARRLRSRAEGRVQVDTSHVSGAQVVGSADQLTRAVRNLLDNAARHARSAVTLMLSETSREVTLVVADDGAGIPPDQRERIFERFTRLDEARARDTGGTGLGLAITQEVVRAHSGTISVENTPGARFTITLPV